MWRLIGKVIFSSLPGMEKMEILDENNFRSPEDQGHGIPGELKLKGEMMDMEPPDSFSVKLSLEGPGGLFKADQKVAFAMTPSTATKTSGGLQSDCGDMGPLPRFCSSESGPKLCQFHL